MTDDDVDLTARNHDTTTPFDRRIDLLQRRGGAPPGLVDSAVFVHDTLETAWMAAQAVFKGQATPEVALAIYDRIVARMPPGDA